MKKKERSAGYSLGCLKPSKLGTLLSARATIKRKCFPVVTASQSYSKLADKSTACPLVIKPTKNGGIKVREWGKWESNLVDGVWWMGAGGSQYNKNIFKDIDWLIYLLLM